MGEILSTIEETLSGLRIIKAFNAENKVLGKQSNQNERSIYFYMFNSIQFKILLIIIKKA